MQPFFKNNNENLDHLREKINCDELMSMLQSTENYNTYWSFNVFKQSLTIWPFKIFIYFKIHLFVFLKSSFASLQLDNKNTQTS